MKDLKDDRDLIYLCGLFDGEGSAGIAHKRSPCEFSPFIEINMTDIEPLILWQNYFGGKLHRKEHRPAYKPSCLWRSQGKAVIPVAESLLRYARISRKREVLRLIIDFAKTMRCSGDNFPLPLSIQEYRQYLHGECHRLNTSRDEETAEVPAFEISLTLQMEFLFGQESRRA